MSAHRCFHAALVLPVLLLSVLLLPGCALAQAGADIPLKFTYTLQEGGQVSAGIFNAAGQMVRPLLYGEKQAPGTYTLAWDGLDRYGQPQPAGTYEWRILRTPGFKREFLVNVGTNISWAPFGYWPGNHEGPSMVVADGDDLYVGSISSEGPPALLKMTQDGAKKYWDTGTWGLGDGLLKVAPIGEVVYLLMYDGTLEIRRADNGQMFYGHPVLRKFAEQRIPFADLLHAGDDRAKRKISPMSMANGKDFLVVTYRNYDEVRLLWPKDAAMAAVKTVKVPQPVSAAVAPDGRVYVVSGNSIVLVDADAGTTKAVVQDPELTAPGSLAYDPAFNDLLVNNGTHVRRYNAGDGKLIAVYGRPQGRTYGVFNPLDFDKLYDIAADGKGGFFTVENYPRRVAHFTGREKHTLVQQWLGGMAWCWQATLDPVNPTIAYLGIDGKHLGRAVIDYGKKSWTLTHLYDLPEHFSWGANSAEVHRDMFPGLGTWWEVRHVAGQTFLVNLHSGVSVVRVDEKENRLVPVARIAGMHPSVDRQHPPAWWIGALKNMGINADSTEGLGTDNPKSFTAGGGYTHFAYSWTDTNNNGKIDTDEIRLGSVGNRFTEGTLYADADWNVYMPAGGKPPAPAWILIRNESADKTRPLWNWDHEQPGKGAFGEREFALTAPGIRSLFASLDGGVTAVVQGSGTERGVQEVAPITWPNNASLTSRLMRWDKDGRQLFSAGIHTPRKDAPAGGFADIRAVAAQVRGCFIIRDACAPATVWTADGLYAGSFKDGWISEEAAKTSPNPPTDDCQDCQAIETKQGEVIWGCNDAQNTVFYRITGWDAWGRNSGKLVLKAAAPVARWQGTGMQGSYFTTVDLSGEPALKRQDAEIWFGPMWGDHREVAPKNNWFKKDEAPGLQAGSGSARWIGFVEAPLGEPFTFHLFVYGADNKGAKVRLWVDNKLVIDAWDGVTPEKINAWYRTRDLKSAPIPLRAGQLVPVKLEYAAAGGDEAHLHLYWDSPSWDLRHIAGALLYPQAPAVP